MKLTLILTLMVVKLFTLKTSAWNENITKIEILHNNEVKTPFFNKAILLTEPQKGGDLIIKLDGYKPYKEKTNSKGQNQQIKEDTLQVPTYKSKKSSILLRSTSSKKDSEGKDSKARLTKSSSDDAARKAPQSSSEINEQLEQFLNKIISKDGGDREYYLRLSLQNFASIGYEKAGKKDSSIIFTIKYYDEVPYTIKIYTTSKKNLNDQIETFKEHVEEIINQNTVERVRQLTDEYIKFSIGNIELNKYLAKFSGIEKLLNKIDLERIENHLMHILYKKFDENKNGELGKDKTLIEVFKMINEKAANDAKKFDNDSVYDLPFKNMGDINGMRSEDALNYLHGKISAQEAIPLTDDMSRRAELWNLLDSTIGYAKPNFPYNYVQYYYYKVLKSLTNWILENNGEAKSKLNDVELQYLSVNNIKSKLCGLDKCFIPDKIEKIEFWNYNSIYFIALLNNMYLGNHVQPPEKMKDLIGRMTKEKFTNLISLR
jgi:hypothetical protein